MSHNSRRPSILILIDSVLSSCLFRVFLIFLLLPLSEEVTLLEDPADDIEFVVGVVDGNTGSCCVATARPLQVSTPLFISFAKLQHRYNSTLPFSSCVCAILRYRSFPMCYLSVCLARLLHRILQIFIDHACQGFPSTNRL